MMHEYKTTEPLVWTGRQSPNAEYLYQAVQLCAIDALPETKAGRRFALLGYCVDEGVRRNQGRVGAAGGPDAIRAMLGRLPVHFDEDTLLVDAGNLVCREGRLEQVQAALADSVKTLLGKGYMTVVLGGGHDIAYGHYTGIRKFLPENKTVGIINFDAHFDLRDDSAGANSGTPFFQIANEAGAAFKYLCLGIRQDANVKGLFETAAALGVNYVLRDDFTMSNQAAVTALVDDFMMRCDYIYTTIDLDGFSSAYAPGVSAASPWGFGVDIVTTILEQIIRSGKLISIDIAEMNPRFDMDHQTAKLAAGLVYRVLQGAAHVLEGKYL